MRSVWYSSQGFRKKKKSYVLFLFYLQNQPCTGQRPAPACTLTEPTGGFSSVLGATYQHGLWSVMAFDAWTVRSKWLSNGACSLCAIHVLCCLAPLLDTGVTVQLIIGHSAAARGRSTYLPFNRVSKSARSVVLGKKSDWQQHGSIMPWQPWALRDERPHLGI